ncbi:MAG: LapA family protein [Chitinophagaceae bacterium]
MIFLKSISDLRSLMGSHKLFSQDPVTLQIPELNPGDSVASESRINFLKNEKGWDAGIKGSFTVMAVLSAILLNLPQYGSQRFFSLLPFILGLGLLAGIVLKFISSIWTRIRLKNEIKKLLRRIESLEKAYAQSWLFE